jgi:hypothetical protein
MLQQRRPRIERLERYLEGHAPLPEAGKNLKESYRDFQKKSRTNYAEVVVEATAERMTPAGFRIGDNSDLSKDADLIWSANELDVIASDVHSDMLALGHGYAIVGGPDSNGVPIITREDPELIITDHDPCRPNKVIAALKMYRDHVAAKDVAYLYLPGLVLKAEKMGAQTGEPDTGSGGYEWVGYERLPIADAMPVIHFRNRRGLGEFETHTDLLDRINDMLLRRLIITAMQAFRQRAIKGDLPETQAKVDENGEVVLDEAGDPVQEAVDWADVFRPGAGALWVGLPEGVDIWESQVTDITPILAAVKDDVRDLAAVTRTPMSALLPDGQNQSAEGAQFAREGLVFKCRDRIQRAGYGWNQVMALALRFSGKAETILDIETLWESPERLTLSERADAAMKMTNLIPFRTLMTEIMQFSPEKAEEMETERLADILASNLGVTPALPAASTNGV